MPTKINVGSSSFYFFFALKNTAFFRFLNFVFHILPFLFVQYLLKYTLVSSSVFLCG